MSYFFLFRGLILFIILTGLAFLGFTPKVQAQEFSAKIAIRQGLCSAGATDGALEIHVTGGLAPYSVVWSTGAETPVITGLSEGTYSATVSDALNGRFEVRNFQFAPARMELSSDVVSVNHVRCKGQRNGGAFVKGVGGFEPYTYQWNVENWRFDEIYNQPAGTYTITITDAVNCSVTRSVTITEPNELTFTATTQSPSCPTCNDGTITLNPQGGTPAYLYFAENSVISQRNPNFFNIAVGTYNFTVRDANGCTVTKPVEVTYQPPPCLPAPIMLVSPGDSYVSLSWNPVFSATRYIISWRRNDRNQNWNSISVTDVNTLSYTINGLIPNQPYQLRIATRCGEELSDWSAIKDTRTFPVASQPCSPPEISRLTPTRTNVKVEWNSVPIASRYIVSWRRKRTGYSWNSVSSLDLLRTEMTINALTPGQMYEFRVQTRCGDRLSEWSAVREVRLLTRESADDSFEEVVTPFTIYPNPARDEVNIRIQGQQTTHITLTDLTGRTLLTQNVVSAHDAYILLDLSTLPAGIYIVHAFNGDLDLFAEKLVLMR